MGFRVGHYFPGNGRWENQELVGAGSVGPWVGVSSTEIAKGYLPVTLNFIVVLLIRITLNFALDNKIYLRKPVSQNQNLILSVSLMPMLILNYCFLNLFLGHCSNAFVCFCVCLWVCRGKNG